MRGKGYCRCGIRGCNRITPAHAGKSLSDPRPSRSCRDHPRACGEKTYSAENVSFNQGSPPRMRGKVACKVKPVCYKGITPAHAGKRTTPISRVWSVWDHPRACGEKRFDELSGNDPQGSPPRMRGKVAREDVSKTVQLDHPRACGEKLPRVFVFGPAAGSPPRMRGKDALGEVLAQAVGITPAHAGKRLTGQMPRG